MPDYVPADTDLLCAFASNPPRAWIWSKPAAVAAESSTGTWTEVWSNQLTSIDYYKAKVYRVEDDIAYIAYPMDLFEENSVVNIMSSIVGNVFGFKAVHALRLEDMRIPVALVKTFPGPNIGIYDERARLNKWDRPLLGGTVKPKLGLSAKDYATIMYECLIGGLDTTKDDENMNSQPFNRWRDRFLYGIDAVKKAEAESGEAKGHFFNVTADSTHESLRRLEYIAAQGSRYVMYDSSPPASRPLPTCSSAAGRAGGDRPLPPRHARRLHAAEGPWHPHARRGQVAPPSRRRPSAHGDGGGQAGRFAARETLGIIDLLRERSVPAAGAGCSSSRISPA